MLNQRQIELQNIIKAQQSKIHTLKREISVIKNQQSQKIQEVLKNQRKNYQEKNKTIQFLKDKINQIQRNFQEDFSLSASKKQQDMQYFQKQIIMYKSKCEELEQKLQKTSEIYETKCFEMTNLVKKMEGEMEQIKHQKKMIEVEVSKMTKFYNNAVHEIPRRKETLVWVDKLIEFMSKQGQILAKDKQEQISTFSSYFEELNYSIIKNIGEQSQNEAIIQHEKQKISAEIKLLTTEAERYYNKVLGENSQFWDQVSKEISRQDKQVIAALEKQIIQLKTTTQKEIKRYQILAKNIENEKKLLILGFQQLKHLNESREKTFKEQIIYLKNTIQELIQSQEIREKQFQNEIKGLVNQISIITERFYEKIEVPINTLNEKVTKQMENVKKQLNSIQNNPIFRKEIQNFEKTIINYLLALNKQKQLRQRIKTYTIECAGALKQMSSQNVVEEEKSLIKQSKEEEKDLLIIKIEQMKEVEEKLWYENSTLRKHNEKLKEQCAALENRVKGKSNSSSSSHFESSSANQIKDKCEIMYRKGKAQAEEYWQKVNASILAEKNFQIRRNNRNREEDLIRIRETNQIIAEFVQKEEVYIDTMGHSIHLLNNLLLKPVQNFQSLMTEVQNIYKQNQENSLPKQPNMISEFNRQLKTQAKEKYKQILLRRTEVSNQSTKIVSELIKTIKETIQKPSHGVVTHPKHKEGQPENALIEKQTSSKYKEKGLEKKIKQMQSQRLKVKEDLIVKLNFFQITLRSLESKYQKRNLFSANKIEEIIRKKFQEIMENLKYQDKSQELLKITEQAFADMSSKLKESIVENEGLAKELSFLISFKSK